MKKICILFFILFSLWSKAQNYQCVSSNTESFFYASSNSYIKGIKPDSFALVASDSVFYHYRTAVDTNSVLDGSQYCSDLILDYPTWQGIKTLIRPNGFAVNFNLSGDSIYINQASNPGGSWDLYQFSNGNKVIATHAVTALETFAGFTDSVKTFVLNVVNQSGAAMSHQVNGKAIKLSKNFGWVHSLNWRDFPLKADLWEREPAYRLTKRKLFEIYPGDVIHMQAYSSSGPTSNSYLTYYSRLDYGSDSIVFDVARFHNTPVPTGTFPPYVWTTSQDTVHVVVTNPDSLILPKMPDYAAYSGSSFSGYDMFRYTQGTCVKYLYSPKNYNMFIWDQDSTCFQYALDPPSSGFNYISGSGENFWFSNSQFGNYNEYCSIYSDSCGNKITVGVHEESVEIQIHIYPNPVSDFLAISSDRECDASIMDIRGLFIRNERFNKNLREINVADLAPGVYFLQIRSADKLVSKRFIKL